MAKTKISEYSSTAGSNTDIDNINIAEACSPANVNNAIRGLMAQLKDFQSANPTYYTADSDALAVGAGGTGAITATTARTNLSAAKSGANSDITSITGLTTALPISQGGTGVQVTRTISSVSLTSNVVTITTSVAHEYLANDSVTVTATTQTTVNGTYTIISVPTSTTFTYAKTASNISPIADTGSVVSSSNIKMANASGTLSVSNGGTGANTLKLNNLFLGNGTSSPTLIPAGSASNVLTSTTTSTVTAGSFVIGTEYTILTVGTTDYTLIGAASSTVGVVFTATGVGTGDGTATTNTWTSSAITFPSAVTLLGTITPTAVNSISLSGLTLTTYKSLFIVLNNITIGGTTLCYISSSNVQSGGGFDKLSSGSGTLWLDLGTGALGGSTSPNTFTGSTGAAGGLTNVSTSTTQIYFRLDAAKTWTASGSVVIYGVK